MHGAHLFQEFIEALTSTLHEAGHVLREEGPLLPLVKRRVGSTLLQPYASTVTLNPGGLNNELKELGGNPSELTHAGTDRHNNPGFGTALCSHLLSLLDS